MMVSVWVVGPRPKKEDEKPHKPRCKITDTEMGSGNERML
jgi:hypothetical protein